MVLHPLLFSGERSSLIYFDTFEELKQFTFHQNAFHCLNQITPLSILPYNVQFFIMSEHSHNCGFKYFMTQKLSQNNKKCKLDVKFQNYEIKPFPILLRVLPLLNAFLCI